MSGEGTEVRCPAHDVGRCVHSCIGEGKSERGLCTHGNGGDSRISLVGRNEPRGKGCASQKYMLVEGGGGGTTTEAQKPEIRRTVGKKQIQAEPTRGRLAENGLGGGAGGTHNVVPVRQGEVVLVVPLVLLRQQESRRTLRVCLAEQRNGQSQRT